MSLLHHGTPLLPRRYALYFRCLPDTRHGLFRRCRCFMLPPMPRHAAMPWLPRCCFFFFAVAAADFAAMPDSAAFAYARKATCSLYRASATLSHDAVSMILMLFAAALSPYMPCHAMLRRCCYAFFSCRFRAIIVTARCFRRFLPPPMFRRYFAAVTLGLRHDTIFFDAIADMSLLLLICYAIRWLLLPATTLCCCCHFCRHHEHHVSYTIRHATLMLMFSRRHYLIAIIDAASFADAMIRQSASLMLIFAFATYYAICCCQRCDIRCLLRAQPYIITCLSAICATRVTR